MSNYWNFIVCDLSRLASFTSWVDGGIVGHGFYEGGNGENRGVNKNHLRD